MIHPDDIDPTNVPLDPRNLASLEEQFDTAIRAAHKLGRWPAAVPEVRDTCSPVEIEHIADRYRAVGWKVVTGSRTERALIDHPARKRP